MIQSFECMNRIPNALERNSEEYMFVRGDCSFTASHTLAASPNSLIDYGIQFLHTFATVAGVVLDRWTSQLPALTPVTLRHFAILCNTVDKRQARGVSMNTNINYT
eukprot:IDg4947t1